MADSQPESRRAELWEELVGSFPPQVCLYHWLEANDRGRILPDNDAYIKDKRIASRIGRTFKSCGIIAYHKFQKLNVPVATGLPTVQYLGQNSSDTASDPNLGQLPFDLKTRRSLVAIPNELLAVSSPAIDAVLTELVGIALAEHEDNAFFATTNVANGPTAIYAASGITTVMVGGSANGGSLAYTDLTAVLAKAAAVKAKGPFAWICSPRTFWTRIAGLLDNQSRPIFNGALASMSDAIQPKLFGSPVWVTPFISETEANGSGTNQSHLFYTNPRYLHVADGGGIDIQISLDRYFEFNQVGLRAIHRHDFGVGPAAGIICLKGIN